MYRTTVHTMHTSDRKYNGEEERSLIVLFYSVDCKHAVSTSRPGVLPVE